MLPNTIWVEKVGILAQSEIVNLQCPNIDQRAFRGLRYSFPDGARIRCSPYARQIVK